MLLDEAAEANVSGICELLKPGVRADNVRSRYLPTFNERPGAARATKTLL